MITARPRTRQLVPPPALLGLAAAGAAAAALALAASVVPVSTAIRLPAPARALLVASAVLLAVAVCLLPHRLGRLELLAVGLAALGAQAALAAVADPPAVAALLVLVGVGHATRPGRRPFVLRARGPAFAALLLGLGWAFVHTPGPPWLGRLGALALALSLVVAAGLAPYLASIDRDEPASASALMWTAFVAPALALALPGRALAAMHGDQPIVFGATLVGLGLFNLVWGTLAAWLTTSDTDAWRGSFLADWGLALVGLGLLAGDGTAAAYLVLLSMVLVRLPLYVWARPALREGQRARPGPLHVLLAAALAGAAPFAGFPPRLLVLQAATQVFWPLAIPLLLGMLLWLAHSMRLARTLARPTGRAAIGAWLVLGLSLLLGLAPGLVRAAGGL